MVNVLDEGFDFAAAFFRFDFLAGRFQPLYLIARQGLSQHFHEWVIAGEKDGALTFAIGITDSQVQTRQGLAGTGHTSDKADGFLPLIFGVRNNLRETVGRLRQILGAGIRARDLFDAMIAIERLRRFDDGRRWLVATGHPGLRVQRMLGGKSRRFQCHGFRQTGAIRQNRLGDVIGPKHQLARPAGGFGGDDDRHKRTVVTAFVEILQVEAIVDRLVDCAGIEVGGAHLELDDKDHAVQDDNRIGTPAHARDGELQRQPAIAGLHQFALQQIDLRKPGHPLRRIQVMRMMLRQMTQNRLRFLAQEIFNARRIIGVLQPWRRHPHPLPTD